MTDRFYTFYQTPEQLRRQAVGALVTEKMTPAAVELALEIRREIEAQYEEAGDLPARQATACGRGTARPSPPTSASRGTRFLSS